MKELLRIGRIDCLQIEKYALLRPLLINGSLPRVELRRLLEFVTIIRNSSTSDFCVVFAPDLETVDAG